MPYYSEDEIYDTVRAYLDADRNYRDQLEAAVRAKNNSWIKRLIHVAIGVVIEIGRAVIAAITGWFIPRPPRW
jgi:hypothetical protein